MPAVDEIVPGYEASIWFGIGVPRNTPGEIIENLNQEISAGLVDPQIKAKFASLGNTPLPMMPIEFGNLVAEETEKWARSSRFREQRSNEW